MQIHHLWTRAIIKVAAYFSPALTFYGVVTVTLKIDEKFLAKAWNADRESPPAIGHVVLFALFVMAL